METNPVYEILSEIVGGNEYADLTSIKPNLQAPDSDRSEKLKGRATPAVTKIATIALILSTLALVATLVCFILIFTTPKDNAGFTGTEHFNSSEPSQLAVAVCGPLPPPANGSVNTSSGTTAGSVALYSCDQGLVLTGSAARVCGNNGQWTPAPPTCEGLPTLPESFLLGSVDSNTAELFWSHSEEVDLYVIIINYLGPCTPTTQSILVDGSDRAINLTGLHEGSEYSVTIYSVNSVGRSSSSISIPDTVITDPTTPTGPPQSFRPIRITTSEVSLAWDEGNCLDRNGLIREYRLRYFPTEDPQSITTLTPSVRSIDISGLDSGTSYTFQVAALFESSTGPFSTLTVTTSSEITIDPPTPSTPSTPSTPPPPSTPSTPPTPSIPVNGCQNGDVRLVGGSNNLEGRVEVCYFTMWGTVCDDGWDTDNANVVCRQLGFADSGALAFTNANFGEGSGPILLDDVDCTGTEQRLEDCPSGGFCSNNCGHSEDAGVRCMPMSK